MTKESENPEGEKPRLYRNPPAEHRFKKGQSGNPKGRPRKERAPQQSVLVNVDGKTIFAAEDEINRIALEEAYRLVRVREGDLQTQVPAIQAILRRTVAAAANGNAAAQKQILELVLRAEANRGAAKARAFEDALEYQTRMRKIIDQCNKDGKAPPDMVPHPDDMILNLETLEVRHLGPVTIAQREAFDEMHNRRDQIQNELLEAEEELIKNPKDAHAKKMKRIFTDLLATINDDETHWRTRQKRKNLSSRNPGDNHSVSGDIDLRKDFYASAIRDVTPRSTE